MVDGGCANVGSNPTRPDHASLPFLFYFIAEINPCYFLHEW